MWYIHTVEYNSALKNKGILIHAKTEGIMLGETGQSQKDKYCIPDMRYLK